MSKQTAVEWLIEMISYTNKDTHSAMGSSNFFDKALVMEREQIEHAHLLGLIHSLEKEATQQATEYYNETYGKEASHEG